MPTYPLAFLAILGAALVQGVTGFAFGILGVALLTLLYGIRTASVVVTFLACWNVGHTLWTVRGAVVWRMVGLLMAGIVLGQPIGARALVSDRFEIFLLFLLAAACIAVAAQAQAEPAAEAARRPGTVGGVLAGVISGFLTTTVSSGGPPVIWYVYRYPLTREQLKATSLAVFACGLLLKFAVWGHQDLTTPGVERLLTAERLRLALALLPAAVIGSTVGIRLFEKVDAAMLRRLVCRLLVLTSLLLATTATRRAIAAAQSPTSRASSASSKPGLASTRAPYSSSPSR